MHDLVPYLCLFGAALAVTLLTTPLARRIAVLLGAVDYPGAAPLKLTAENAPDGIITRFDQLLDVFPGVPDFCEDAMEKRRVMA